MRASVKALAGIGILGFLTAGVALAEKQVHKAADGTPIKLAFVTNNSSDFWRIAEAGVKKYTAESGVQCDVKMPPTGTVEEQNRILEDLTVQGYTGLAISVIAPNDQVAEVNAAAAKLNVITQDSDAAKTNRLLYVGTNNFEAGRVLGKEIVKLLPGGGKVAVFVGTFSADNATQRLNGIEKELEGHGIEVVAKKEDNKDMAKAQSNVDDVIVGYPDIKVLVGLWSYNGPAIASAIESAGKKGTVLAAVFDEEEGTLAGIAAGTVACTVVQKPFQFGYQSAKLLNEIATKGESAIPGDVVDTGVDVINKDNVADFKKKLDEMRSGK